jgi:hypothetical protein
MVTFLLFYFFPSLDELFIQSHVRDSSGETFTDSLETVKSTSYHISSKKDATLTYTDSPLYGSLDESFSGLIDNLPCSFSYKSHEYVGITEYGDRSEYLVDSLDELFDVEL